MCRLSCQPAYPPTRLPNPAQQPWRTMVLYCATVTVVDRHEAGPRVPASVIRSAPPWAAPEPRKRSNRSGGGFPYEKTPIPAAADRARPARDAHARRARGREPYPGLVAAGRPPADLHELWPPHEAAERAAVARDRHREGARELALPRTEEEASGLQRRRPRLVRQRLEALRRGGGRGAVARHGRPLPGRRQRSRVGDARQERHQEPESRRVRQVRGGSGRSLHERAHVLGLERAEPGELAVAAVQRESAGLAAHLP